MPPQVLAQMPEGGVLLAALRWIEGVLLGTVGTSIAVIAIAFLGFAALTGRVDWRQGLRVLLGCFILFGAPAIAREIAAMVRGAGEVAAPSEPPVTPLVPPKDVPPVDPYAGASVPM